MILPALLALASPVAVYAAPVQQGFAGALDAVDACFASTSLTAIDSTKLSALGWTEQKIEGVEQSKDPYRLFAGGGAGAVILFNYGEGKVPHCHVLVARSAGGTDALANALTRHVGGGFLPGDQGLGDGAKVMRVPGRPFILALRPYADDKDLMGEIHIMPVEGSE